MSDFYQTQKAMRQLRQIALQRGVAALLDLGTSKITCLIVQFDTSLRHDVQPFGRDGVGTLEGQAGFRIIGVHTTRARGMRLGEIQSVAEVERAIRTAVQGAQKMAGTRVDHVIACLSGAAPQSHEVTGDVGVETGTVSEQDVSRALAACDIPDYGTGRDVLHAQPVNFVLDGQVGLRDPRGQTGQVLATDMHMVTVNAKVMRDLLYCVKRCDLELAGIASSSYMAALGSLTEDEQELGAAVVDMGGGTTGVSVFFRKHMIHTKSVRFGGDLVTRDISMGLQIPWQRAERIKTLHGGVEATGMDDRDMIDLHGETGDWERDRRQSSRTDLIGIMRPRVEEILEDVRQVLDDGGFYNLPNNKVVLTGGGSQIPGLENLASQILGHQVRPGYPIRISGMPQAITGPGFCAAIGLVLYAAHPQDEWWDFPLPSETHPARSLRRTLRWFRDHW